MLSLQDYGGSSSDSEGDDLLRENLTAHLKPVDKAYSSSLVVAAAPVVEHNVRTCFIVSLCIAFSFNLLERKYILLTYLLR